MVNSEFAELFAASQIYLTFQKIWDIWWCKLTKIRRISPECSPDLWGYWMLLTSHLMFGSSLLSVYLHDWYFIVSTSTWMWQYKTLRQEISNWPIGLNSRLCVKKTLLKELATIIIVQQNKIIEKNIIHI